jgi:hypothetical protein
MKIRRAGTRAEFEHGGRAGLIAGTLAAFVLMLTLVLPSGASASEVLLDQTDPLSPQSYPSQDFEAEFNQFDATLADDFTVPVGFTWTIESVLARGKNDGSGIGTTARVTLYEDGVDQPGPVIATRTGTVTGFPRMQIAIPSPPTLATGTYWISVESLMPAGSFDDPNQWFWAVNDGGPFGAEAVFKNPGDGFKTGCTTFTPRIDCVFPDTTNPPGDDLSFSITGTPVSNGPTGECLDAQQKLTQAKKRLAKAKKKAAKAEGKAEIKKAKEKVKKAKRAVRKAQADVDEDCL